MQKLENLKEQTKKRFLDDVIVASAKEGSQTGLILILDHQTANILTNCMNLSELMLAGITAVESIEKTRKAFPNFKGIYFLVPTKENIELLQKDFDPKRIYKNQNVFFSRQLSDSDFQILTSKSFSKKLGCLKEFNLDFLPISDNVFKSSYKTSIELQADSILSVIATQQDVSQVELFKCNSPIFKDANQIFTLLNAKIKAIFPYLNSTGKGIQMKVFIFDRNMDLVSPLVHDFHYESMLADFVENEVQIFSDEYVHQENQPMATLVPIQKIEANDKIYKKFRYEFIKELMSGVSNDFNLFLKENATAKAQKNKDTDMGLNQMQNVVRGIGEYNETIKQFKMHVDFSKKIMEKINKNSLRENSDAELTVATGISDQGETVNAKNRVNGAKKFQTQPGITGEDKLRMALIANGALFKSDISFDDGLSQTQKSILEKHQSLVSKFGKFIPENISGDFTKFVKAKYDASESHLERFVSRAELLVSKTLYEGGFSDLESVKIEQPNNSSDKKGFSNQLNTLFKAKINANKVENSDSLALVYFAGGVSFVEICALMKIAKKGKMGLRMIVGSTEIYSPKRFVSEYLG